MDMDQVKEMMQSQAKQYADLRNSQSSQGQENIVPESEIGQCVQSLENALIQAEERIAILTKRLVPVRMEIPCEEEYVAQDDMVQRYSNMGMMLQQAEKRVRALELQMQKLMDELAI